MKPITRKEYYLAKAAGTYTGPTPPPVLREDYYLATLAGDYSGNCPAPVTRLEKYMSAAAGLTTYVPQPVTRIEKYWYAIAKGTGYVPDPVTREERFLYALVQNKPEPPKPEYVDKAAEGSTILLTDSAQAPLTALTVYGKSTQDGTPSPENPVPIVSAGDEGEINVTVSDGGTQSQTLTLSTPNGLSGIPVKSGGNYTDETGQQWIADVKDYGTGKYTQNCEMAVFDGSGDEAWVFNNNHGDFFQFTYSNTFSNVAGSLDMISGRIISNIGLSKQVSATLQNYEGFWLYDGRTAVIVVKSSTISGTELDDFKTWLKSNPVTVLYHLTTPIVTDISAEEMEAYKALHTYTPNTTVSNDAEAWMKVGYKATS